jgi:serine/threonine protein kinase
VNPFRPVDKTRDQAPGTLFKCQLHRRDIQPDKVIGAGQFGQVYLATYKGTTKVAVKTVRLAASDDDKEDFVREAEVCCGPCPCQHTHTHTHTHTL